ncbi:MAG: response regulator transcription factor [Chitinophagaceae bacterium]|nr:response regulator transcription factor [Chitinophagaceae bacterium]
MTFSIALAEDNKVNQNTFLQKINLYKNLKLIFSAENGHECLEHLKGLPPQKMPQVIFMDLEMPEMDGIQTISIAKALYPDVHFIVLTVFDDDEKIFEAIKAGASGYLLKHEPASVLRDAVINVLENGGSPMSPAIARKTLKLLSNANRPEREQLNELPDVITSREKEILQYTVNGWDAKRIAIALDISVLTVRKHIANIYQKLHIQSRAQVLQMAHKNKWFTSAG